jgi:hypothetical protein
MLGILRYIGEQVGENGLDANSDLERRLGRDPSVKKVTYRRQATVARSYARELGGRNGLLPQPLASLR